jgi:hypothetical protein
MNESEQRHHVPENGQDQDFDNDASDVARMVPVVESIRYRRRAQSAEKKAKELSEQLEQAHERIEEMSNDMEGLRLEKELTHKLTAAGATDLEAAMLIARARMRGADATDIDDCIARLKQEKLYLFASPESAPARKTAGVRDRVTGRQTTLERAAGKAAQTGTRADLHEYLRLRRKLL